MNPHGTEDLGRMLHLLSNSFQPRNQFRSVPSSSSSPCRENHRPNGSSSNICSRSGSQEEKPLARSLRSHLGVGSTGRRSETNNPSTTLSLSGREKLRSSKQLLSFPHVNSTRINASNFTKRIPPIYAEGGQGRRGTLENARDPPPIDRCPRLRKPAEFLPALYSGV